MTEYDEIIGALSEILRRGGVETVTPAYPFGAKKRYEGPVVAVSVKSGKGSNGSFYEYLGTRYDEVLGESRELFGKRLELTVALDIYSPKSADHGAGAGAVMFSRVADALSELPSGLKIRELRCSDTQYDTATDMYLCRAELECTAFMCAERRDECELLGFTLKGTHRT